MQFGQQKMYKQSTIEFDVIQGAKLATAGMELAVETANAEHPKWSERCWQLFYQWLNRKPRYFEFMVEDFRKYVYEYDLLEKPKSERSFGILSGMALRRNLIEFSRMDKVKNVKAHRTPVHVWRKK